MRILIIGGTRFMGPCIVKNLHAAGHEVTIFHRGQTKASLPEGTKEILGNRDQLLQHADTLRRSERIDLTETFRRTITWESANPPTQIDANMFDYQAEDQVLAGL